MGIKSLINIPFPVAPEAMHCFLESAFLVNQSWTRQHTLLLTFLMVLFLLSRRLCKQMRSINHLLEVCSNLLFPQPVIHWTGPSLPIYKNSKISYQVIKCFETFNQKADICLLLIWNILFASENYWLWAIMILLSP